MTYLPPLPHLAFCCKISPNMAQEVVEANGVILESLPNTTFKVKLEDGREILAHLAGKMRLHHITVMPGDQVKVQMTPYDKDRGRIVYRVR